MDWTAALLIEKYERVVEHWRSQCLKAREEREESEQALNLCILRASAAEGKLARLREAVGGFADAAKLTQVERETLLGFLADPDMGGEG